MSKPQNLTELKEELLKRLEEANIANSMANYEMQKSLNTAIDIKSNKKLIVHFNKAMKYQLGIIAALGEHARNAIELSLKTLEILEANDPRSVVEEPVLVPTEGPTEETL